MAFVIVFCVLMLPGLALLIFVVAQFVWRGSREIDSANGRNHDPPDRPISR